MESASFFSLPVQYDLESFKKDVHKHFQQNTSHFSPTLFDMTQESRSHFEVEASVVPLSGSHFDNNCWLGLSDTTRKHVPLSALKLPERSRDNTVRLFACHGRASPLSYNENRALGRNSNTEHTKTLSSLMNQLRTLLWHNGMWYVCVRQEFYKTNSLTLR